MHFETCFKINSKRDDQTDNGHDMCEHLNYMISPLILFMTIRINKLDQLTSHEWESCRKIKQGWKLLFNKYGSVGK